MTPAEMANAPVVSAEPQYLLTFVLQKEGDSRALEVRNSPITVALMVENPLLARLIKAHSAAIAAHDAGQLTQVNPDAPQAEGKPN